ncbi:MAG: phage tail protein, partial [Hymenobacter sp.]
MDFYLGELRLMSFPFAPKGWMYCQGQLLPVLQNQALFTLLGTTYGGDGKNTFGLPDLRGRTIVGIGAGPGLSPISWGQQGGQEGVALTVNQIPPHSHTYSGTIGTGDLASDTSPNGNFPAKGTAPLFSSSSPIAPMNTATLPGRLSDAGSSQPHENRQPTLVLNYA